MKKVTKFEADDGTVFDTDKKCKLYEAVIMKLKKMFSVLPPLPKNDGCRFANGTGWIQHDSKVFNDLCNKFYKLACQVCPYIKKNKFEMHTYGFWRCLNDAETENADLLYDLGQRILNTNRQSYREYGQGYYVEHESEVEGKCLNE